MLPFSLFEFAVNMCLCFVFDSLDILTSSSRSLEVCKAGEIGDKESTVQCPSANIKGSIETIEFGACEYISFVFHIQY